MRLGKDGNGKILMVFDLVVVDLNGDDESGTATLALAQIPSTIPPLSSMGMWLELPSFPLFAGETFTTNLYAHTGGVALGAFIAAIHIEAAPDITFQSISDVTYYDITSNVVEEEGAALSSLLVHDGVM